MVVFTADTADALEERWNRGGMQVKMVNTPRRKVSNTKKDETSAAESGLDERRRLQHIAQAAYFKAESRGFAPGGEMNDWLVAEREFNAAADLARFYV